MNGSSSMVQDPIDQLIRLFEVEGPKRYDVETVDQLAHGLQCAAHAEAAGASPALVAASLLHDVGHLLEAEKLSRRGIDGRHESSGERYLATWFGPDVTRPVALHVAAKRFLMFADADYGEALSSGSTLTLALQGGPMTEQEATEFLSDPHARDAVRLRRWDEAAKVPGAPTPDLAHFRPLLEGLAGTSA